MTIQTQPTELPRPLRPLAGGRLAVPGAAEAASRLRELGVEPITWGNAPRDRYEAHEHGFSKLLICAAGSITFLVGDDGTPVELSAGDGFEMPAGTRHAAIVGPQGCTCVEGHRR